MHYTNNNLQSLIQYQALSPSRAEDFRQCPLLYKFRVIDKLTETKSFAQLKGLLVHIALEQLYKLPSNKRMYKMAINLLEPSLEQMKIKYPQISYKKFKLILITEARNLISNYYYLESPTQFYTKSYEHLIEINLKNGTPLKGFIDRVDSLSSGEVRIVDYKTGKTPYKIEDYTKLKVIFQMKFYAVMILNLYGVVSRQISILYLTGCQEINYYPTSEELKRFEYKLASIWRAIKIAKSLKEFPPNPSHLCLWCKYKNLCPAFSRMPLACRKVNKNKEMYKHA